MFTMRLLLECPKYVVSPSADLYRLFTSLIQVGESFNSSRKKANVVSVHKKNNKRLVKNYCSTSCYLYVIKFLNINSTIPCLISYTTIIFPAQSGFKPDDSCFNQQLSTTLEIYHHMDESYEIRYFLIYRKHLIRYATKVLFLN